MPELPEVEILKRSLNKNIKFAQISEVKINNANLRYKIPKYFNKTLKDKIIKNVSRISKYLIFHLNTKKVLLVHLGMSGTIHLVRKDNKKNTNASFYSSSNLPQKHNHIEITFKNNIKLIYNDPRRFGYFKILSNKFINEPPIKNLGPDPFSQSFNSKYISNYIKNKKKNIKNLLMDQTFVSGIGNIYANEVLYHCRLNPLKKITKLSKKNIFQVIKNTRKVLIKAIIFGGSTIRNFKRTDGESGNFQQIFKVYGKTNIKCPRDKCNGILKKIVI